MSNLIRRGKKGFFWLYYYENNKKKGVNTYTNDLLVAKKFQAEKDLQLLSRKSGRPIQNISYQSFVQEYLNYSKSHKRPNTYIRDSKTIKYFNQFVSICYLNDISMAIIEQFMSSRKNLGLSIATINRELVTLKGMLSKAVEWGYLSESPAKKVRFLKGAKNKVRFLSKEEIKLLLNHCNGCWKDATVIALNTGFRLSEVLYLRWDDISEDTISVTPKGDFQPKTYESRTIPLNDTLKAYLKDLRAKSRSDWIIIEKDGTHPTMQVLSAYFRKIVKRAGIKDCSFHTLRHTCASHLAIAGVDLYVISKLLGHTSIKTTQIYAHLKPEYLKESINKISF